MKKNAQYRRAVWLGENGNSLGSIVEQCLDAFSNSLVPRFTIAGSTQCIIARKTLADGRRYLHFVVFESGAPVAIIETLANGADELQALEKDPDGGEEYIQHQLFCLIQENHVLWTGHNNTLRENAIRAIFVGMIHAAGLSVDPANTQFMFQIVLDEAKVQALFQSGIQEIDLGLGALRPTLERIAAGGTLPDEGFWGAIAAMVSSVPSAQDLEAAERIEGKLVLRPGRAWDRPEVIDLMASISNNIRNEDEFVIVTKSGLRLTREKMSLHQPFEVSGNKRVLSSFEVDNAFREIFETLDADGILNA